MGREINYSLGCPLLKMASMMIDCFVRVGALSVCVSFVRYTTFADPEKKSKAKSTDIQRRSAISRKAVEWEERRRDKEGKIETPVRHVFTRFQRRRMFVNCLTMQSFASL